MLNWLNQWNSCILVLKNEFQIYISKFCVYSEDCKIKKVEAEAFVLILLSSTCETFAKTFIILRKLIFQNVIILKDHKITNGGHQLL